MMAQYDIVVAGGGAGGVAAALAGAEAGRSVLLVSAYDWLGGQLTTQGIPPDEHRWIELCGCTQSYRNFRDRVRAQYRATMPLTDAATRDPFLNPGNAWVSRLAYLPRVGAQVIEAMLAPHVTSGRLTVLRGAEVASIARDGTRVTGCTYRHRDQTVKVGAGFVLDATETGDLLPLSGTAYVTGAEAKSDTGEMHALLVAEPQSMQAITVPFAIEHCAGEDHTISKPPGYDVWAAYAPDFWCGKLFSFTQISPMTMQPVQAHLFHDSQEKRQFPYKTGRSLREASVLWSYRRIHDASYFTDGSRDVTMVVWIQNDYWLGSIMDVSEAERAIHIAAAKTQSLSLLYCLQTEAPRPDGGCGYPELRLADDVFGTEDGLSVEPYIREGRRIRALFTVKEQHIADHARREAGAAHFPDSVGIGMYRIDLHPDTGGHTYVDLTTCPFQIPLGALIPVETDGFLPAAKNIGTTHITNGAYRLHPVEWNVGEAAGALAAFCLDHGVQPRAVHCDAALLAAYQHVLQSRGVELEWPDFIAY
jgi:hypothetical protein